MRVALLFCEGKFDVALLRRVLKGDDTPTPSLGESASQGPVWGWHEDDTSLKGLPTPLSTFLIQEASSRHGVGERKVSQLTQPDPPLPAHAVWRTMHLPTVPPGPPTRSALILAYQMNGDRLSDTLDYLKRLKPAIDASRRGFGTLTSESGAAVREWSFGFLFDGDASGKKNLEMLKVELPKVLGPSEIREGEWVSAGERDLVGALLLRADEHASGTLESMLVGALTPHFAGLLPKAQDFLKDNKPPGKSDLFRGQDTVPIEAVARKARLLKASLVVLGQYDRPDQGLTTIIGHANIFDSAHLRKEPSIGRLLEFVRAGAVVGVPDGDSRHHPG